MIRRLLLGGLVASLGCPGATPSGAKTPTTKPEESGIDRPLDDPEPQVPSPTPEVAQQVARSVNAFGVDMYGKLASRSDNMVFSPASISIAFSMTQAGARGETAQEMARVFHFDEVEGDVSQGFASLLADWSIAQERLELAVANRLFGDAKVDYEGSFLELTRKSYGAPLEEMDFRGAPEPARRRINEWVEKRTHDRIRDLIVVGGIDPSTRLVLVNAIYFKAAWLDEFSEHATRNEPFTRLDGTKIEVPMMHGTSSMRSAVRPEDGLKVIEIPYVGGRFSLTVIVPDRHDGLPALEAELSAARIAAWVGAATPGRVELALPKFRIEPDGPVLLSRTLGQLGLQIAFDPARADFTGIAPASEQLALTEAFHKAFIDVDERGTEAAAATAVGMRAGTAPPSEPPPVIRVDRPFLYLVRDIDSGAILFMGRVVDPSA